MSIFDERLRPEEVAAGFNPGEPDDDSMLLEKMGKYPGDFPYYREIALEPLTNDTTDDEIIENPEGNIWDMFPEEDTSVQNTTTDESQSEEITETNTESEISTASEFVKETENAWTDPTIPVFEEKEETNIQDNAENQIWEINTNEPLEDYVNEQRETNVISIDDELKSLLAAELETSKAKKKRKEEVKEPITEESNTIVDPELAKKQFKAVEEQEKKVDYIDLNNIDNTSKPAEPEPQILKKEVKSKKTKAPKSPKPPKEKKERKKAGLLFWIASSVAGLLIIAAASYFAINYYLHNYDKIAKDSTITQEKQLGKKEKQSGSEDKSYKSEQHKKTDSTQHDTTNKAKFGLNEGADFAHSQSKVESITTEHKVAEKPISTEKKITHKIASPKNEPEQKKVEVKKKTPSVVHNKPKEAGNQLKQTTTKLQVAENKIIEEPKIIETPKVEKQIKAVYTIQVYSTPSYEDAQIWIKKLYSLNISNAYISTQKIRDVVWYRVRFGEYNDKQNAINDARRLGFSQTWVDRIK